MVYYLILLRGYRKGDLSVVYPLARGTWPLLTALVVTSFFGESLRVLGWLGVLGIVGGIVLIAGGPALIRAFRSKDQSDLAHEKLRAGVIYGLLTGVFIAIYTLADGYAVKARRYLTGIGRLSGQFHASAIGGLVTADTAPKRTAAHAQLC